MKTPEEIKKLEEAGMLFYYWIDGKIVQDMWDPEDYLDSVMPVTGIPTDKFLNVLCLSDIKQNLLIWIRGDKYHSSNYLLITPGAFRNASIAGHNKLRDFILSYGKEKLIQDSKEFLTALMLSGIPFKPSLDVAEFIQESEAYFIEKLKENTLCK